MNKSYKFASVLSFFAFSSLYCQNNIFDASNYTRQSDLFLALTNNVKKHVDSNLDTLLFKANGDKNFSFTWNTYGGSAPSSLSAFEENRVYQNMIFENSSVSNTWSLGATHTSSCNPCQGKHLSVTTKSLSLNNTAMKFVIKKSPDINPNSNQYDWIEELIFENANDYSRLNLNNAQLLLDNSYGSSSLINFRNKTLFDIKGKDNILRGSGGAFNHSLDEIFLNINQNSNLTINGATNLQADYYGHITMKNGSSLKIVDSRLLLSSNGADSKYFSSFDNASIFVSGLFSNSSASLEVTNPTITNSSIFLDNNTYFRSIEKTNPGFQAGDFYFIGDNKIVLNSGSKLTGSKSSGLDIPTAFNFSNGTTNIDGAGALDVLRMSLNNAKVVYSGNNISNNLEYIILENSSELKSNLSNSDTFNKLRVLRLKDSLLSGANEYGYNTILKATIDNSTLKIDKSSRTSAMTFHLSGINNASLDGYVQFNGNNKFISRVDPQGKDVGLDLNVVTGIKTYADAIYFNRRNDFNTNTVFNLSNLDIQLEAFSNSALADDYSNGGKNSDGIYDVIIFKKENNTVSNNASSNEDNVNFILGASMPALLKATQVATPSSNNQISVKLETKPLSTLISHPVITTPNQQGAVNLLVNGATSSNSILNNALNKVTNAQLQAHTNTIHAEPYSSYMTVSLEHTDMIINSVLNNSSVNMSLNSPNAKKKLDTNKKYFWFDTSYLKGDIDANKDLGDFEYTLSTLTLGNDFITKDYKRAGLFVSFGTQKMDEHDSVNQEFKSDNYYIGAYLSQKFLDDWSFSSILGYGYGKHKTTRNVNLSNLSQEVKSNFNSHALYTGVNISKNIFKNDLFSLRPEIGLNYTYYQQEKIKENANTFALNIDKANAHAVVGSIGINVKFKSLSNTNKIYPLAFIKYEHDFYANNKNAHKIDAALNSNANYKQEFKGQNKGSNGIITAVGLSTEISDSLHINTKLLLNKYDNAKQLGARLNLKYIW